MKEVLINFESENREGIVAVGTYLIDAAKRLGIEVECDCTLEGGEQADACVMKISQGGNLLTEPTQFEIEHLSDKRRQNGERLACQAKFEKPGDVVVMSVKKKEPKDEKTEEEKRAESFKKEFEEMPLEKKIANLVELEAMALGETFSYVLNSPYAAVGKVMDVLAEFGLKMEKEDQAARRPDEHRPADESENEADGEIPAEDGAENGAKKKSATTAADDSASKSKAGKKVTVKKTNSKKAENRAKGGGEAGKTAEEKNENGG